MAPSTANATADRDNDLDPIFGVDVDDNDLFRDIDTNIQAPGNAATKRKAADLEDEDDVLGLSKEVNVKKQRQPIAKLNEARYAG